MSSCVIKLYTSNLVVQVEKCHNEVEQNLIRKILKVIGALYKTLLCMTAFQNK